jgi:hypothetical protein
MAPYMTWRLGSGLYLRPPRETPLAAKTESHFHPEGTSAAQMNANWCSVAKLILPMEISASCRIVQIAARLRLFTPPLSRCQTFLKKSLCIANPIIWGKEYASSTVFMQSDKLQRDLH